MKKRNLGGEPKETAVSRENVPADGNNPAQRNEAGISARPPLRPSDQSVTYLSPTGAARARLAVIFPVLLHRLPCTIRCRLLEINMGLQTVDTQQMPPHVG